MKRYQGIVKWFDVDLGYGYISIAPSVKRELGIAVERDLYVHSSDILGRYPRRLFADEKVTFAVDLQAKRGSRAIEVCLAEQAAHVPFPDHGVDVPRDPIPAT